MEKIIDILYGQYLRTRNVVTDSRAITPGCIFFAFKGEKFDGNSFAPEALSKGAALCVIDDPNYCVDSRCILVPNVLETLQQLARHHRDQQSIPFIGITGTNGKTTTKELVNAVLSKKYRTHSTKGNYNNHLGVPLTILSMPADTEIAIIEMGANHPGEIDFLCNIAHPDYGLITNVGKAHLAGFGSFEGVVRTKTELYRFLQVRKGTVFVNADNSILMEQAGRLSTIADIPSFVPGYIPGTPAPVGACNAYKQLSVVTYGSNVSAEVKGSLVGSNPYMKFYVEEDDNVYTIQSKLLGNYNFDNAMAAVAVGRFFSVELFDIKEALESYAPENNRSQYKQGKNNALVMDCYNANPSSMKVSVENFAAMQASHKVVMLGGMKELGAESAKEHQQLVDRFKDCDFERIVLVGNEFAECTFPNPDVVMLFDDVEKAKHHFQENPLSGATVLLKGSNSTRMWLLEEVL